MNFLTIEQIVDAARNDVAKKLKKGLFIGQREVTRDDQVNVQTITSLYSQWAENEQEAEDLIWTMFRTEFGKFL